ncbi:MAG: HTH domain-containing protein [Tenuifilum sp.]|uniref:HTH domain-containing protein n=1 Tax=Tenuifilum sp. TaxID=2760880 RepID=UPI0030A2FF84
MNIIETKHRLEYLDFLLRSGKAGTAAEIASKLGVSERTVRCYFEQLAIINVPLEYDHEHRTWRYSRPGKLTLSFIEHEPKSHTDSNSKAILPPPP